MAGEIEPLANVNDAAVLGTIQGEGDDERIGQRSQRGEDLHEVAAARGWSRRGAAAPQAQVQVPQVRGFRELPEQWAQREFEAEFERARAGRREREERRG